MSDQPQPATEPGDVSGSAAARNEQSFSDRCAAVVEHALDAILVVNAQGILVDINPAASELLAGTREQCLNQPLARFLDPVPVPGLAGAGRDLEFAAQDGSHTVLCSVQSVDGLVRHAEVRATVNFLPGLHLCMARDISEKKFAEDALQRADRLCRTLVETTNTGYVILDPAGNVLDANAEYVRLSGHSDLEELRGRHPREWTAHEDCGRLAAGFETCARKGFLRDLEVDFINAEGHRIPVEIHASADGKGQSARLLALCRDITGRLQTQQELNAARAELESRVQDRTAELHAANDQIRLRARQQETVAEVGRHALAAADIDAVMQDAVVAVAAVLAVDYCAVLEQLEPESNELVLRACVGWTDVARGDVVASTDPSMIPGYALGARDPIVFEDLETETRFQPWPGMREAGIVSGATVTISDAQRCYGLLSVRSKKRRQFTSDDTHFLQCMANVLAAAIERRRSEEAVRLAQLGAVQANNAKIDFLSRMSHELRTPLNAILGFSQLLEIERLNDGQRESVEQIARAGRHLLELVNEVLDISRIDSGNMALVPEPLAVNELWTEAVDLIRPLADAREITITLASSDEDARYVLADRQRLRQVLLNLLSNAVKYNQPHGSVTLSEGMSPDGLQTRLSITDTGLGIAPENLSLLFTPFERLGAENTNVEGSGMGLALSKRLVEAQGGTMGVETTLNVGSTFWIDLPVAAAPLGDEAIPTFLDDLIQTRLFEDVELPADEEPVGHAGAAPVPLREYVVLHIEDNEPNQRLIEMLLLQRPALRLLTASRGMEGLELAQKHHPDLILLDVHLPDTSGENVLQDLRADEGTRNVPVVIVSADAASIRHHQLHEIGADNYLLKPFNVTQFLKILDEYLVKDAA